jgi:hypothetical protein
MTVRAALGASHCGFKVQRRKALTTVRSDPCCPKNGTESPFGASRKPVYLSQYACNGDRSMVQRRSVLRTVAAGFVKVSGQLDKEWMAEMDGRGFDGKKLFQAAKALISKHDRA